MAIETSWRESYMMLHSVEPRLFNFRLLRRRASRLATVTRCRGAMSEMDCAFYSSSRGPLRRSMSPPPYDVGDVAYLQFIRMVCMMISTKARSGDMTCFVADVQSRRGRMM